MNGHELLDKLDLVNDRYIMEAEEMPRKRHPVRRWGSIAAVLCVVVALALIVPQLGGRAGPGDGGGYTGHEGPTEFMSYEGPVLPLTAWEETELTAQRHITMDFSSYGEDYGLDVLRIRDGYILMNPTDGEIIAMVSYPVAGSFRELPAITAKVDGAQVETTLSAGMYSGDFRGAGYETTSMNLHNITSWEGYHALLEDGSYMAEIPAETPALDDIVIVYKISNISHSASEAATNPSINFAFDLPKDAICLSYGFNGGRHDPEGGPNERHFSIPKDFNPDYGKPKYLIFLGEDISGYTMQGYTDGSCEPGKEMNATATVERYETTLGEILDECAAQFFDIVDAEYFDPAISKEMYLDQVRRHYALYGATGSDTKERYRGGYLEDIVSEVLHHKRVLYYTFPLTVPAGESVAVDVTTTKLPSYDFDCTGSPNAGIDGYDMVTQLGSPLTFTGQSAAIENYDFIDIVRQNFGFDPANGITEVELDMAQEHYYIEVREIKEN